MYIGDGSKTISALKYVGQEVDEAHNNLKNGGGQGSLIQTNVKSSDDTPYTNIASGPASIALGKNTQALGNTDFVIGQSNEDNSSGSFVGGSNCTNTGDYSLVFGRYLNNTHLGAVRLGFYNKDNDYTAFSIGTGDLNTRKNGLEYDAKNDTLSIPTGNISYGANLQGNTAYFSGKVTVSMDGIETNGKVKCENLDTGNNGSILCGGVIAAINITSRGPIEGTIITATNYFNATSDKRLKENIKQFEYKKSILDLPTYTFNFKNDKEKNLHLGCLAQDLQEICPEIVHENEEGYLSIEETKLVYLLLEEVKKLKVEVDKLRRV